MSIDVESGESSLCPVMHDISQKRISFIRRVYSILTFQLLLTIAIVSVVVFGEILRKFPPLTFTIAIFHLKLRCLYTLANTLSSSTQFLVVFVPPVANFLNNNIHDGVLEIVTFLAFCSLCCANKKHPICYFFHLTFTVSVALTVGLTCATVGGVFASGN
ncbi:Bax inhibitor-1 family protein [Trifolium repens]|nr:Bax inhibitor-1 family protein [Trifolium repens]KAK2398475.1 Bax inhibitor-1 family protein [Trifolium repens]